MNYRVDFDSLPWEEAAPGARFKAVVHEGRKLRLVEFTTEFVEQDWCRKGHAGVVLEGEIEIDFSGTVLRYTAGDGVFIPGGETAKHKAKVPRGSARLLLVEEA